ncbi:hypothetical protein [Sporosarcina sp. OR05]|uniref:hypothetical protein n=1 Tax=Sporosarcina sp. OR05 TaxID=2969819 RepID=UPI003529E1D6
MSMRLKKRTLLLIGYGIGLSLLVGCNAMNASPTEKLIAYEENFEIKGQEKEQMIGTVSPAIYKQVDRGNENAEQISIPVVPKEGVDVQLATGRYVMTGDPVGNIFVYDKEGRLILTEIVGSYAGAGSLTIDVDASYTVRADGGYDTVSFTPISTSIQTESLSTGLWVVGTDIEAGTYTVSIDSGYGYLHVLEEGEEPLVYEMIGGSVAKSESRIDLHDGQIVRVKNASFISFKKVD